MSVGWHTVGTAKAPEAAENRPRPTCEYRPAGAHLQEPVPIDPLLAPPRLLEVSHVAHRLSVGQRFVWQLIRDGKLPAIRLGPRWRVDPADLQTYIDAMRHGANGNGGRA